MKVNEGLWREMKVDEGGSPLMEIDERRGFRR